MARPWFKLFAGLMPLIALYKTVSEQRQKGAERLGISHADNVAIFPVRGYAINRDLGRNDINFVGVEMMTARSWSRLVIGPDQENHHESHPTDYPMFVV